jgi:hypothetical protein
MEPAMSAEDAVNEFLTNTYGLSLEEVLYDAAAGKVRLAIADAVKVTAERIDLWREDDGGVSEVIGGALTVEGVTYHYRCSIFTDRGGDQFLTSISEFAPTQWQAKLTLPRV